MSFPLPIRNIWVHNVAPPPGVVCLRVATNQLGEAGVLAEPLLDVPGSGTWTGAASGAVGTHIRYEYEEALSQGSNVFQQYIVMTAVTGSPFTDGEILTPAPS